MAVLKTSSRKVKSDRFDANTRLKLLRVATELFARRGFDRVSVREIAHAAGANISMVSYYFGGKEGLYKEIFETVFERVKVEIERSELTHKDINKPMTREDFMNEFHMSLNFMLDEFGADNDTKIVMHRELMDGFPRTKKIFDKHFEFMKGRISHFYERAQIAGHIKKSIDPVFMAILLNRAMEAYIVACAFVKPLSEIAIDPVKEREKFIFQVEEIFLRGVMV